MHSSDAVQKVICVAGPSGMFFQNCRSLLWVFLFFAVVFSNFSQFRNQTKNAHVLIRSFSIRILPNRPLVFLFKLAHTHFLPLALCGCLAFRGNTCKLTINMFCSLKVMGLMQNPGPSPRFPLVQGVNRDRHPPGSKDPNNQNDSCEGIDSC